MKTTMIILLCTIFIFCSCEGERGLTGATGEHGKDLEIEIITGILSVADYTSYEGITLYDGFWSISINKYLTDCIVTVNVQYESESGWIEPYWIMGSLTIFIFDDHIADMGNKYRIAIAQ